MIGCNTFPTWNSYPGLFASLVTGNAVVVKPHPRRGAAAGHHRRGRPRGARRGGLLTRPGAARRRAARRGPRQGAGAAPRGEGHRLHRLDRRSATGWSSNAHQASVFTEKAGVNTVVVDSTDDYRGHAGQPRVLAVALQRPDVHHPAEPAGPPRRHHRRRRAQVGRRAGGRPRRRGRRTARRRRARDRPARRGRQPRRARPAREGRRRTAMSCSRPGR